MNQCETHQQCLEWLSVTGTSSKLPTRLLEVGNDPLNPTIRLVLGQSLSRDNCRYATLSHCWGDDLPTRLLQHNLASFFLGIPWDILPLTFQEAALTIQRLKIKYLWIDALCIIQDSHQDWANEAATMRDVYLNSYLNISADDAKNPRGGLFRDRNPYLEQSLLIPLNDSSKTASVYCCYIDRWYFDVESAPLKDRAWVVQERFLSPRVVHFSSRQVHWECGQLLTSEALPCSFQILRRGMETWEKSALSRHVTTKSPIKDLYHLWVYITYSYARAKLSILSDRSVAIDGVSRVFCHFFRLQTDDYTCGLWRPWFFLGLVWGTQCSLKRIGDRTPSWSWLSVDRESSYHSILKDIDNWKSLAELVEVKVSPESDPFGPVTSGYAKIRGQLSAAVLSRSANRFEYCREHSRSCRYSIAIGPHTLRQGESLFIQMDENDEDCLKTVLDHTVYLLLVGGPEITAKVRKEEGGNSSR
jgi:hypothetical protein